MFKDFKLLQFLYFSIFMHVCGDIDGLSELCVGVGYIFGVSFKMGCSRLGGFILGFRGSPCYCYCPQFII